MLSKSSAQVVGSQFAGRARFVWHALVLCGLAVAGACGGNTAPATAPGNAPVTKPLEAGFSEEQFSRIPAGSFQMGTASGGFAEERPVHSVTLSAFRMQKTEVTQGQWRAVMGTSPSVFSACGDSCPVEGVSYLEAQAFIDRLNGVVDRGKGYRLPTEAEWEYAARGGTTGDFNVVNTAIEALGWINTNAQGTTHPSAQKLPNAWGLYDMHGNVWEWVSDWSGEYPSADQTNPSGPATGTEHVLRSGSWLTGALNARSAVRSRTAPTSRAVYIGFRLARAP